MKHPLILGRAGWSGQRALWQLVLTVSIGLAVAGPARADITLVYGEAADTGESPSPSHQIHIREGGVSIANAADKRLLIFDVATGDATVVDHTNKVKTSLNQDGIRRLAARFAESQIRTLAQIEENLAKLPKEEREALRGTIDLLNEANVSPEKLSAPAYRYEGTGRKEVFLTIPAAEATVFRGERPEARALLATREAVGFLEKEFAALQELQQLLDGLARMLSAHMQSWIGSQGLVSPDGRLVLQTISEGDPATGSGRRMELLRLDREPVEAGWFEVPATYDAIDLEQFAGHGPVGPKSENVSEK